MDGQSIERFAAKAEDYLAELSAALREGSYHPQAVKRVDIPKGDGRTRPLSRRSGPACRLQACFGRLRALKGASTGRAADLCSAIQSTFPFKETKTAVVYPQCGSDPSAVERRLSACRGRLVRRRGSASGPFARRRLILRRAYGESPRRFFWPRGRS